MNLTLDEALQKGVEAHKAGKAQEADRYYTAIIKAQPKHPDANHNMGVLAVGVGKVETALPFFKTAIEANPKIEQFWLSYIDALIKLDRMAEAKAVFDQAKSAGIKGDGLNQIEHRLDGIDIAPTKNQDPPANQIQALMTMYGERRLDQVFEETQKLTKQYPKNLTLWNLMGASAAQTERLDQAVIAFQEAIKIKPDFADAYNNMGIVLKDQGKLDEAIEAFEKGIAIAPNIAETYNNLGNALQAQDKLEEAIEAFQKALSIKPGYAEAHNNLGIALQDQGRLEQAIDAFKQALSIKPSYADAYNNLSIALQGIVFNNPNRDFQKTIISLLDKARYVRPKDISQAVISLLKLEPSLQKHLKLVDAGIIESPLDVISELSDLPLLLKLMSVCPLPDLELEGLLTNLRCSILLNISSLKEASSELIEVQSALALQCFTNEYIYNHTEEEEKALKAVENIVQNAFRNKEQPSPQVILALASYKALNEYDWCNLLAVTDDIQEVFSRQVEEPSEEGKLKEDIPILEEITDRISSKVRAQYEDNPYPRWVNLGLPLEPASISNVVDKIKLKLYDKKITEVDKPEILIAGCGTGQHSIGTAARFKSSEVLAIDLSLSSLAYAKRKTKELGIGNIEYMQADILNFKKFNKQFDIIESSGVLHHIENPMAGWRVLTDCLNPGGLMKIGLYSELAREPHVKIRNEISKASTELSDKEIKYFRNIIIKSDKKHHKSVLNSLDFYSLSTLRDLLFHVQEHRFTIPQLKNYLDKLGLRFCGFETQQIVADFKQTNKNDPYDLDKWQAYEEANPRAFAGMYQFWCQKIG